jgi:carbamoyl-phosphate synthase small subunit
VRHLRTVGALRGVIADGAIDDATLVARAQAVPSMAGCELASRVTDDQSYGWAEPSPTLEPPHDGDGPRTDDLRESRLVGPILLGGARPTNGKALYRVVAMDYGIKWNILRRLVDVGCDVTVVPANTTAKDVLALSPDGVVLSNGPGDPEPMGYAVRELQSLIGRVPVFGICLGHQLLGLAAGGRTYKLKFGHRGGNHPVMDLTTRKVEITSHNHGFAVDPDSLPESVEKTHIDLNDQTLEGLRLRNAPAFSVQYHPEAAPGPHDAHYLFARFAKMMQDAKTKGGR